MIVSCGDTSPWNFFPILSALPWVTIIYRPQPGGRVFDMKGYSILLRFTAAIAEAAVGIAAAQLNDVAGDSPYRCLNPGAKIQLL